MSFSESHPHRRSSSQGRTAPPSSSASLPPSFSSRTPLAPQSQARSAEASTKVAQKLANAALDPIASGKGQKVPSGAGGGTSASAAYKRRRVDEVGEKGTSVREDGAHGGTSVKEQLAAIGSKLDTLSVETRTSTLAIAKHDEKIAKAVYSVTPELKTTVHEIRSDLFNHINTALAPLRPETPPSAMVDLLETENSALQQKNGDLSRQLSKMISSVKSYSAALDKERRKTAALEARSAAVEHENEVLNAKERDAEQSYQLIIKNLETELSLIQETLAETLCSKEQLLFNSTLAIKEQEQKVTKLESQIDTFNQQLDALTLENSDLKNKNEQLREGRREVETDIRQRITELQTVRREIRRLEDAHNADVRAAADQSATLASLSAALDRTTRDLDSADAFIRDLRMDLADAKDRNSNQRGRIRELETENTRNKEHIQDLEQKLRDAEAALDMSSSAMGDE